MSFSLRNPLKMEINPKNPKNIGIEKKTEEAAGFYKK